MGSLLVFKERPEHELCSALECEQCTVETMTASVSSNLRLSCLTGLHGAGKDEVARSLVEEFDFIRIAFADRLKRAAALLFDLSDEQLWGGARDRIVARIGHSPRALLQHLGDACAALYPDFLVHPWRERVSKLLSEGCHIVCSDLRTMNERVAALELGGVIWRLVRPEAGLPNGGRTDPGSRQVQGMYNPTDVIVRNDKGIADLRQQVRQLIWHD